MIKLNPKFPDSYVILGKGLLELGDRNRAEAAWKEAARLDPKRFGDLLNELPPIPLAPTPRAVGE